MEKNSKIYIAGHRGLAGSAIVRKLKALGYDNLLLREHRQLDLTQQEATRCFFENEKPEYVFLAAAVVGGILANNNYPADFIHGNLAIQTNVIHEAWRHGVKRLLFLGSSCIYPKFATQPLKETYLLSGYLEPTNRPYAVAKIAGIEMCWSYNRQHGTRFLAAMPTNLYGPGDRYDLENSHVIPAMIKKFHDAKTRREPQVVVWGSGRPLREFLYSEDMADACIFLMNIPDADFDLLLGNKPYRPDQFEPPVINIGSGEEFSIAELANIVKRLVGFDGEIIFDSTKPDGTPRKLLDSSKLASIGWKRQTTLPEGLRLAYSDYRSRSKTTNG